MKEATARQNEVVRVIQEHGPHLTYAAIARLCGITGTAAKARVQALVKKGYVSLGKDPLTNAFILSLRGDK